MYSRLVLKVLLAEDDLDCVIFLSLAPECWDHRYTLPHCKEASSCGAEDPPQDLVDVRRPLPTQLYPQLSWLPCPAQAC